MYFDKFIFQFIFGLFRIMYFKTALKKQQLKLQLKLHSVIVFAFGVAPWMDPFALFSMDAY